MVNTFFKNLFNSKPKKKLKPSDQNPNFLPNPFDRAKVILATDETDTDIETDKSSTKTKTITIAITDTMMVTDTITLPDTDTNGMDVTAVWVDESSTLPDMKKLTEEISRREAFEKAKLEAEDQLNELILDEALEPNEQVKEETGKW